MGGVQNGWETCLSQGYFEPTDKDFYGSRQDRRTTCVITNGENAEFNENRTRYETEYKAPTAGKGASCERPDEFDDTNA